VSSEVCDKIEHAQRLLSHAVPSGDLATVLERALDELIAKETRRRIGTGRPRKRRELRPGSRRVPVDVARVVWKRDEGRCAFVNAEGRRCSERRFLTIEHRQPFAQGGPATPDNLCLFCKSHNGYAAEQVFGKEFIQKKRESRARRKRSDADAPRSTDGASDLQRGEPQGAALDGTALADRGPVALVHGALRTLQFREVAIARVLKALLRREDLRDEQSLLRAALEMLVPDHPCP